MAFEKPKMFSPYYAEAFKDESLVAVYHTRPPYPAKTFEVLGGLISEQPRRVLDAGCGLGEVARRMLPLADYIDAVDFSAGMIRRARTLPGGHDQRIYWQCSGLEKAELEPPYSLIVAGDSIGWFDLNVMMPRFASILTDNGYLAIVSRGDELGLDEADIIGKYSVNQDWFRYNVIDALVDAGLFRIHGQRQMTQVWEPTVEEFLNYRHSHQSLSEDRMGAERAAAFDEAVRERIRAHHAQGTVEIKDGRLQGSVVCNITWGKPLQGK